MRKPHMETMKPFWKHKGCMVDALLESRNLFNVQTLRYDCPISGNSSDVVSVYSTDLDNSASFLLVGLSNGSVDIQGIEDSNLGTLEQYARLNMNLSSLHRVQWNPGDEQFFSMLDNHNLLLVDPVEMRAIERFKFNLKINWSEWNPNDRRTIAICGSESQTRLVDIRSGSSAQTMILAAESGLPTHRATRCLWSKMDTNCLIVGDNEGYLHVYDTRRTTRPLLISGSDKGQISGMSFTTNQNSVITTQGTENSLVIWSFERCSLQPDGNKFRKIPTDNKSKTEEKVAGKRKKSKRIVSLPVDAYVRCQFYVTDRHIYCPAPSRVKKSKEIYVYDIESGLRIKTIRSNDIMSQGVYSVTGLLPDALTLFVGGRGRLRVWRLDEGFQKRMEERMRQYHTTSWDSDEDQ